MAEETAFPRSVTVSATGTAVTVPDMATISTGVVSEAATAEDALRENSRAMLAVMEALRSSGVDLKDIQTTDFSVQPRYRYSQDGRPPAIEGYNVVNSVRIRVREIKDLGNVLDAVVREGSNQISGIEFEVSNAEELLDRAREDAVAKATSKARLYARAAGAGLGEVISISEVTGGVPVRPVMMRKAIAESVPIEAGTETLSATVTISWELR